MFLDHSWNSQFLFSVSLNTVSSMLMLSSKEQFICFYWELEDSSNPGSHSHFIDLNDWKLSCSPCEISVWITLLGLARFVVSTPNLKVLQVYFVSTLPTALVSILFPCNPSMLSEALLSCSLLTLPAFPENKKKPYKLFSCPWPTICPWILTWKIFTSF